jgi:hypothetical protein
MGMETSPYRDPGSVDSLPEEMSLTVSGDDVPSELPGTGFMTDAVLGEKACHSRVRVAV